MRYHVAARLSPRMAETPEGYLICLGVPIARTGVMEYAPDETPVETDAQGRVLITRTEEEVFASEVMASFEGKAVTVDHPNEDVTPLTWKERAVGHAQNIRRGEGIESDLLLADLVICDREAIDMVRGGLREISCGYDADYEQTSPGRGQQTNIRGNHIALVRRGRCGPSCKINDTCEDPMPAKKKRSFTDTLLGLLKNPKTRRALDEAVEPGPEKPKDEEHEVQATDEGEDRIAALEATVEELGILVRQLVEAEKAEPEGEETADEEQPEQGADDEEAAEHKGAPTGDRKPGPRPTRDARTVDADTKARAQLLYPGMRVADADKRCAVQRAALRRGMQDAAIKTVVEGTLRGSTLDNCDCLTLDAAFLAASEVARATNNKKSADGLGGKKAPTQDWGRPTSPADINKANSEFYSKGRK